MGGSPRGCSHTSDDAPGWTPPHYSTPCCSRCPLKCGRRTHTCPVASQECGSACTLCSNQPVRRDLRCQPRTAACFAGDPPAAAAKAGAAAKAATAGAAGASSSATRDNEGHNSRALCSGPTESSASRCGGARRHSKPSASRSTRCRGGGRSRAPTAHPSILPYARSAWGAREAAAAAAARAHAAAAAQPVTVC